MKLPLVILILFLMDGCSEKKKNVESIEMITLPEKQDSLFKAVSSLVRDSAILQKQHDSMAFLILPIEASCPSCRKKTIDSLMKHKDILSENHFIIISAPAGIKGIGAYFKEQNYQIPKIKNKLYLDTTYLAYKLSLFDANPAIFYAYNAKVYKKVYTIPATIKEDLREFFSGYRIDPLQKTN